MLQVAPEPYPLMVTGVTIEVCVHTKVREVNNSYLVRVFAFEARSLNMTIFTVQ